MKKIIFTALLFTWLLVPCLQAQIVPQGMNYQAVARDAVGSPLAYSSIYIKISFNSSEEAAPAYYTEQHQVTTDEFGLFNIVIGTGKSSPTNLLDIPWEKEAIWMNVEMSKDPNKGYQLASSAQVLSTPYAFYAQKTKRLEENNQAELRNQSIRWLTSGNLESRPSTHFIGTRDAKDLVVKTNDTRRAEYTAEGQFNVYSGVGANGKDDVKADYPMTVEGSTQGIYIKVNGSRNNDNNFLSFADDSQIWGRVEGQTTGEFFASSEFINTTAFFVADAVILGLQVGAGIAKAAGLAASIFGAGATPLEALEIAQFIAEGIGIAGNYATWLAEKLTAIGVVYESGNGDYAEYLLRADNIRDLLPAEIVGVKAGIVSLDTKNADHVMAVSTAPIVLGNAPQPDQEDQYEKIAFMGQVPVRIAGPVQMGDFIIASGNNDGLGIAVNPENMQAGDYPKAVGIAWETKEDPLFNIVNVAVGINTNDLSKKAALLNKQVDNITDFLEGKAPLIKDPAAFESYALATDLPQTKVEKSLSDEAFNKVLNENEAAFNNLFKASEKLLRQQGFDFGNSEQANQLFSNPVEYLQELRKDPKYTTQWSILDNHLKQLSTND